MDLAPAHAAGCPEVDAQKDNTAEDTAWWEIWYYCGLNSSTKCA